VETQIGQTIALPEALRAEYSEAQEAWRAGDNTRRLWNADATLWTGRDEAAWLGWLSVIDNELRDIETVEEFARQVRAEAFADVLLLGMGGSSLGPEVLARSLGSAPHFPRVHILDSTDPQRVRRFAGGIDPARTLFIVSSKSGTTLEPNALMDYFFALTSAAVGGDDGAAGRRFVAITDPGSPLEKTAHARRFRRVFHGDPRIGGRYSVLSKFGLVPLAASGGDARAFLTAASGMARACGSAVPPPDNPGVALGLVIGVLARAGRDKLTIVASPSVETFGLWAEQLLAESTGKDGRGVIPVADEPLGAPSVYGADRLFVFIRDAEHADAAQDRAIESLQRAGQPVVRIGLRSPAMLAQEFFRFEIATAVAGAVLGVNPFDQPDVEASKVMTRAITEAFEKTGALPAPPPEFERDGVALHADRPNAQALRHAGAAATLESWFRAHLGRIRRGDYFALLAYIDADDARLRRLQDLRAAVRDAKRVATCLQFGPRFLHSTGQAYKGGPNTGVFLQLTAQPARDLDIPGRKARFGVIEAAQAAGDGRVLAERGRRILHVHIAGDLDAGLAVVEAALRRALQ